MCDIKKISRADSSGSLWVLEAFLDDVGNVVTVRLYDPDGWFVAEFWSKEDAERFVDRVALG